MFYNGLAEFDPSITIFRFRTYLLILPEPAMQWGSWWKTSKVYSFENRFCTSFKEIFNVAGLAKLLHNFTFTQVDDRHLFLVYRVYPIFSSNKNAVNIILYIPTEV